MLLYYSDGYNTTYNEHLCLTYSFKHDVYVKTYCIDKKRVWIYMSNYIGYPFFYIHVILRDTVILDNENIEYGN